MPYVRCYADFSLRIKMAVACYTVKPCMSISEELKFRNVVLKDPSRELSQLSVVGRFQDHCLSNEITLCLLSLHKKRSNTVVFLASSFAGQNI